MFLLGFHPRGEGGEVPFCFTLQQKATGLAKTTGELGPATGPPSYPAAPADFPSPARIRLLERPQGPQPHLLRFGEPPDAGDIEPLIGPVAAQGTQQFAALEVPEPDGPVIAATGQEATIGTHLEGLHRPLMGFSLPYALPARQVPPAQPTVTASTEEPIPDRVPGDGRDDPRQPLQGGQALPTVGIPHEQLPPGVPAATTSRSQPHPILAPGDAHDGPLMPRQLQQQPPISRVPHIDVAIIAPGNQAPAIRTPGHPA